MSTSWPTFCPRAFASPTTLPPAMSTTDEKTSQKDQDAEAVAQVTAAEEEESCPDGGLRAWLVVVGCFIINAVIIGFCFVWGVYQSYYAQGLLAGTSPSTLGLLGSIPGASMTVLSALTGKLADRYKYKPVIGIGCILWVFTMLGTAFSTKIWHFALTQGLMQGIAGSFIFPISAAFPSQWFRKKRAFSTGIVLAGSSFGAAGTSAIIRVMLSRYGLRKTMLIKTGIDGGVLAIAYLLIKERRKPSATIVWYDKKYLTDPTFWSITLCICLANFGYPQPFYYLPTFAKDKVPNLPDLLAALSVTVLNVSSGVGRCCVGFLADRIGPTNAMFFVVLLSGLAQLLVWNFISDYAGVLGMSVLYGFFGVCFWSLATPVAAWFYGTENLAGLTGLLFFFTAPGELLGPPISGAIYETTKSWHWLIAFSGGIQVAGAFALLYARFKREPSVFKVY